MNAKNNAYQFIMTWTLGVFREAILLYIIEEKKEPLLVAVACYAFVSYGTTTTAADNNRSSSFPAATARR